MWTFLIAGFEANSTALAWSIHLLSKHPEVQEKIKTELSNSNVSQVLSVEQLDSLTYLDCVIKETLRFSSPSDGASRSVVIDDRLPKSGVQLHKGDQLLIPLSILGRLIPIYFIRKDF
jgi:cytochrome P450